MRSLSFPAKRRRFEKLHAKQGAFVFLLMKAIRAISISLGAIALMASVSCKQQEQSKTEPAVDGKGKQWVQVEVQPTENLDPLASMDKIEIPKIGKISMPAEVAELRTVNIRPGTERESLF